MGSLTYSERAANHPSPVAQKLLRLMDEKKTNLCASVDLNTTSEVLDLIEKVGPNVCLVKTHMDLVDDFTYEDTILPLLALAKKYNFMIFEDRKYADIGNTVKQQYKGGVFRVASFADITNAHGITGPGIVAGLKEGAKETTTEPRGLLMLAELSSKGSLAHGEYTKATVDIARTDKEFVFGFIAQHSMGGQDEGFDWLILTPGVGLDDKGDKLGQQYRTPEDVFATGTDIIIVGRGLFAKGRDPVEQSKRYRDAAWAAYKHTHECV